jgi:hypothetical protein
MTLPAESPLGAARTRLNCQELGNDLELGTEISGVALSDPEYVLCMRMR